LVDNTKIDHENYQKQIKVQKKEIQKLKTKTQENDYGNEKETTKQIIRQLESDIAQLKQATK
ncbi:4374_t:CDS:2, partial [Entrophospora sp. SA101]